MSNQEGYPEYLRPVPELPENVEIPPSPEDTRPTYSPRHPAAQAQAVNAAAERLIGIHFGSHIQEDATQSGAVQYYSDRQSFGDTAENFADASALFGAFQEMANERIHNMGYRYIEPSQANTMDDIHEKIELRDIFDKLDPRERIVLTETVLNGQSDGEAAKSLHMTEETVTKLRKSATKRIRAELLDSDGDNTNVIRLPFASNHNQQD